MRALARRVHVEVLTSGQIVDWVPGSTRRSSEAAASIPAITPRPFGIQQGRTAHALVASDPEGPIWLLLRAVFRVLAGRVPEGLLDLSLVVPRFERFARIELWFGLEEIDSVRRSVDRDRGIRSIVRRRLLATGAIPLLDEVLPFDDAFLDRSLPSGAQHQLRLASRWKGVLATLLSADGQRKIVEGFGKPGEAAHAVLGRVVDLLARTLAMLSMPNEARAVARMGPLLATGLNVERLLADVALSGSDLSAAASGYAKVLTVTDDPASLRGLAWCRIAEAARTTEKAAILEEARSLCDRAAAGGMAEAEVDRVFALLEGAHLDEARRRIEALVAARPGDAVVWILSGEVAARSGDVAAAGAAWDRAVEADRLAGRLAEHLRETRGR